ncbi:DUF6265 family protein [Mucilaginibacter sp. UR6-11]|uniref:DUF6265 family protein n=1 Tax=Mucilaginibacter sp. UR6-11 TaxID=1435644 RepID=UPI001E607748|nr:DUF6265 family protein [Mucilaginibacter sp. UR6-11]MCC8426767.1 DUF6265 family protein [Mucilaginibacter sp. UR6-11]
MKCICVILLVFTGLFPVAAFAQVPAKSGSFSDISFIEGHWKATTAEGRVIEAVWLAPAGDNILGFMRMMNGDKADLYEILAYEQTDQGLTSLVKHFKPGLLGQEEKDSPNRYLFVEASKDRAVFQNVNGDLRILYEKRSSSRFAIARGSKENGQWVFKDLFVFNKVK